MKLTVAAVERLKPSEKRREIPDDLLKGLYLIIQPSGRKSWAARTRIHDKPVKITLGRYPAFGLAEARKEARSILQAVAKGEDPRLTRAEAKASAKRAVAETVEAVVSEWLQRDQEKNSSYNDVKRAMERNVLVAWRKRPISSIGRRDVIEILDPISDRGAVTMARRVHAYLHRLFRWSVARDIIPVNPMANLPKPGKETARSRVLSDDELMRLWYASEALEYPFGPAVRLLILSGARRNEITALQWTEIDEGEIRLEGTRTKTERPRVIPLAQEALDILESLPRISNPDTKKPEYCFTTNGRTPVAGWSKAKKALDAKVAEIGADGNTLAEPVPLRDWRIHDLRRTVATGLQKLGARLEVIEAVLGHVAGSRAGIVGVYQRHEFEPEKRQALEAWARHVRGLVGGPTAKVVPLLQSKWKAGS